MIRHRLSCSLHTVKNKPLIYIKNKSIPLLLAKTRPFVGSFNSQFSVFSSYSTCFRVGQSAVRRVHNGKKVGFSITPLLCFANADTKKK